MALLRIASFASGIGPRQAEWAVRHHAEDESSVRSRSPRREIPWDRLSDEREGERPQDLHGHGYATRPLSLRTPTSAKQVAITIGFRSVLMKVLFGRGAETTFSRDLTDYDALALELQPLVDKVWRHFETTGARGRTATLKVKFSDFELVTRWQVSSPH